MYRIVNLTRFALYYPYIIFQSAENKLDFHGSMSKAIGENDENYN